MANVLKVMLVDDEHLFREALKVSIPWDVLGLEICCEAENGAEALEKLEKFRPDIALVDINMPIIDGLEFASQAREKGFNIKLVIITGYEEFSYARQVLQHGVEDYLLKPIVEKELVETLLKIKEDIWEEEDIVFEYERLKKQVKTSKDLYREKFINNLLQHNFNYTEKENALFREYLVRISMCKMFQVVTIEMDEKDEYGWSEEERKVWAFAVSNIAEEIFSVGFCLELFNDIDERICLIVSAKDCEIKDRKNSLAAACDRVRICVSKYLKFTISTGIGGLYHDTAGITISYKESVAAMKNRLILGGNRVFTYESINGQGTPVKLFSVEQRKQLLFCMKISDLNEVQKIIAIVFQEIRIKNPPVELVVVACVELVSTCFEFTAGTSNIIKDLFDDRLSILEEISSKKSIDEMEIWVKSLVLKVVDFCDENKDRKSRKIVVDVKQYIYENYRNDDLNIDDIVKKKDIQYGYLCRIFKRDTGLTINDYITEVRMKKAKELIEGGNCSVSGVSSLVGYSDANYFGKCFKKIYGISPRVYLEQRRYTLNNNF